MFPDGVLVAFSDSLSEPGNAFVPTDELVVRPFDLVPAKLYLRRWGHFNNDPTWVEQLSRRSGLCFIVLSALGFPGIGTNYTVSGARAEPLGDLDLATRVDLFFSDLDGPIPNDLPNTQHQNESVRRGEDCLSVNQSMEARRVSISVVVDSKESSGELRQERQWPPQELSDLAGLRIGIGEDGSGTRPLAELMLREVGLFPGEKNVEVVDCDANEKSKPQAGHTRLVGCSNDEAKNQLEAGKLDAAFFVVYPDDERTMLAVPANLVGSA